MKVAMVDWKKSHDITSCRYYFWEEFAKRCNDFTYYGLNNPYLMLFPEPTLINRAVSKFVVRTWLKFESIKDIKNLSKLGKELDFLIMNERLMHQVGWERDLGINVPKVLILNDFHYAVTFLSSFKKFLNKNGFVLVLSKMKFPIKLLEDKIDVPMMWFPWSINTNIFRDYDEGFDYDVVSSGMLGGYYPLRFLIRDELSNSPNIRFVYPEYPNVSFINNMGNCDIVHRKYARWLSSAKIFIFSSGIYSGAVQKYWEGMASSCLVIAEKPRDNEDLGFYPMHNFVELDENFMIKIWYYLEHEEERREIVENAHKTIQENHTSEKRADQLMNILEGLK